MIQIQVNNTRRLYNYFLRKLTEIDPYSPTAISYRFEKRHLYIKSIQGNKYYCLYKKEGIRNWREFFPELEVKLNKILRVESINTKAYYDLVKPLLNGSFENWIIFIGSDYEIYKITKEEFIARANKYKLFKQLNGGERVMCCYFTNEDRWVI